MKEQTPFDVAIIGSGPGGYVAAIGVSGALESAWRDKFGSILEKSHFTNVLRPLITE